MWVIDSAIREVLFRLTDQFETRYASQIRDAERDENRPHDHQPDLFDGPDFDDPLLF
ncbi:MULTISPECIES: hypothetical protein [unclassified Thiocapsa]|uniref:hypothetical protein n=1 Tax=unclassified Thiocapsa TaxID=2641286 RepID=UPI0035AF3BDA